MFWSVFFWHMSSMCVNTHMHIYICIQTYICIYIKRENLVLSFLLLYCCLHDFFPLLLPLSPAKSRPRGKVSTGLPAILTFQIIQEEYHRVVSPILFPCFPSSFLAVSLPWLTIKKFFTLLTLILLSLRLLRE